MLGLTVEKVYIAAQTSGGLFSTTIELDKGLNIIRAENSSGKSTCVNAIAYGLGLDGVLGPSRKRPFPKSLYDVIFDNKRDENEYYVSSSFVKITVRNSEGKVAVTARDIKGNDCKVSVTEEQESVDYFMGTSGTVGSAKSERGFHHWLAKFIGWNLPTVAGFDGEEKKLYLECIFPLFFIEQKRGWSEIQANIPTTYGIKNVKRVAIEFCLGIDSFEYDKKVAKLKNKIESLEKEWEVLKNTAEGVADFNTVILEKIPDLRANLDGFQIEFKYHEGSSSYTLVQKQRALGRLAEALDNNISKATPSSEKLELQQATLETIRREAERANSEISLAISSLSDIEIKITTLSNELDRYKQLKRLRAVGSSIEGDLETEKCPICESDLYDTLGESRAKRKPMTLDENIEFLKNQMDFYLNIKRKSEQSILQLRSESKLVRARVAKEEELLRDLKSDLKDINGDMRSLIRQKLQMEIDIKEIDKLTSSLDQLNEQAKRIYSSWKTNKDSLKRLKENAFSADKATVKAELLSKIKENLKTFNFTPVSINSISISDQTLRPEQEGYDIVAETSASDYIRIIWAYTLALLQLAGEKNGVSHGGVVVFDEPRQHEASQLSFANLIRSAVDTKDFGGQVLFATSLKKEELEEACEGRDVNLHYFDDYILSLNRPAADIEESNDAGLLPIT